MSSSSHEGRYHSFDALRAGALLLGIALHATMSFLAGFRATGFPIADVSQSDALEVVFFVVHIFRMALFFLVAGFFARLLLHKTGIGDFIRNRLKRIGLPLLIFYPLIMPLTILPIVWAAMQLGMRGPGPGGGAMAQGFPWGHLWFLYLLLWLYALILALRGAGRLVDPRGVLRGFADRLYRLALETRLAPIVFAAPTAAVLYATAWWPQGAGIPSPLQGFVPNLPALVAFGSAMLAGWWLHRDQSLLEPLRRDWKIYLALAAVASLAALALVGVKSNFQPIPMPPGERAAYAAAYMVAVWGWCLGLTGLAMSWLGSPSARWRYLADASYWMYLVHVPIVFTLQAWMMKWPLHWSIKFALILTISAVLLLASYHYLVRSTFLGKLLNGRRYPRALPPATPAPSTSPG